MRWQRSKVLLLIVVSLVYVGRAAGDDLALRERFLREYPPAALKLRSAYANARGTVLEVKKIQYPANGGKTTEMRVRSEFAICGSSARLEIFDEASSTNPAIDFGRIAVVGPRGAFRLVRHTKGSTPELKSLESGDAKRERTWIDRRIDTYLKAASGDISPIVRGMALQTKYLTDVQEIVKNDKKLVMARYEFEATIGKKNTPFQSVFSILVSPEEGWALQEYSSGPAQAPEATRGKIEYDSPQGGVPRPRRMTTITEVTDLEIPDLPRATPSITTTTFEFEHLDLVPTPESEFSLEAFGLGKIESPPVKPPTKSNSGPWFFGLAALGLVTAVGLKILASRSGVTQPTGGA